MKADRKMDFDNSSTGSLFVRLFFPTLLGMFFGSVMNITDGIFVGRKVGSDALASINIAAPVFMIAGGLAMMFGIGASVIASIALAQNDPKKANGELTRAIVTSSTVILLLSLLIMCMREPFARLFGSTPRLLPLAVEYLDWTAPFLVFNCLMFSSMFYIRLDGAPRYAMAAEIVPALLNILLDWIFIYPLDMGIKGAAIASSLCGFVGALMGGIYLLFYTKRIHLCRLQEAFGRGSHALRSLWQQAKVGVSGLFGEISISLMLVTGNYVFGHYMGEAGMAAYSIVCYCSPLLFMIHSSVANSMQPIVSYDYGRHRSDRVKSTLSLALLVSLSCALLTAGGILLFCRPLVSLFVDSGNPTYRIAVEGIPYFTTGFLFLGFNIVMIGLFQSLKQAGPATLFTLVRGYLFLVLCFVLLPLLLGNKGAWLAIPASEGLTALSIAIYLIAMRSRRKQKQRIIPQRVLSFTTEEKEEEGNEVEK